MVPTFRSGVIVNCSLPQSILSILFIKLGVWDQVKCSISILSRLIWVKVIVADLLVLRPLFYIKSSKYLLIFALIFLMFWFRFSDITSQKQLSIGVLIKKCSKNMQQIYWRTSMLKCHFNKVAKQLQWNYNSSWVLF